MGNLKAERSITLCASKVESKRPPAACPVRIVSRAPCADSSARRYFLPAVWQALCSALGIPVCRHVAQEQKLLFSKPLCPQSPRQAGAKSSPPVFRMKPGIISPSPLSPSLYLVQQEMLSALPSEYVQSADSVPCY